MKVAIIGSGMGGLSAAIHVAKAGHDVTVYEKSSRAGGKVGFTTIDGVRCDTGPSVVTMIDVIESLELEGIEFVEPDPGFVYHWPDGSVLRISPGFDGAVSGVDEAFGSDAAQQCATFLRHCAVIWENAAPSFVYADAPKIGSIFSAKKIMRLSKIDSMRSMMAAIDRTVKEPHLRDVFMRYATYNGSDPRVAPATLNCIAHVELANGSYGIKGGYYQLAQALVEKAKSLGVAFVMNAFVKRVVFDDGVKAIRFDDQEVAVDAVVSNVDDAFLETRLLLNKFAPQKLERSMSGWNAIVRSPGGLEDAHSVFFPTRYDGEFEAIFDRRTIPDEPTVYICNQKTTHGVTFDNGDAPLFIMVNAPPDPEADYDDVWTRIRDVLSTFGVTVGEPRWSRSPKELSEQFPGSDGAIYGSSSNNRFAAFKRPRNKHRISGLYTASGTAHPGGGVPMCLLSGAAAARALLDNGG